MRIISLASLALQALLFLSGCIETKVEKTDSVMLVWKSPSFKYADMGFVSDDGARLQAEIYGSGSAIMRLKIDSSSICMNRYSCMSKAQFNRKLLSPYYPDDTLENIFRGRAIFAGNGLSQGRNGFTQKIEKSNLYHIVYKVLNKQIDFHDTINQIVIKVIKQ